MLLVSDKQWSDSVIHIYVAILFQIIFPFRLLQSIEQCSLGCTVGPCVVHVNKLTPSWQVKKPGLGAEGSTCWSLAANFPRVFSAPRMQQHHIGSLEWLWGTYLHLQISQCCKLGLCSPWDLFPQHREWRDSNHRPREAPQQHFLPPCFHLLTSGDNTCSVSRICCGGPSACEGSLEMKTAPRRSGSTVISSIYWKDQERTRWVRTEPVFLN